MIKKMHVKKSVIGIALFALVLASSTIGVYAASFFLSGYS